MPGKGNPNNGSPGGESGNDKNQFVLPDDFPGYTAGEYTDLGPATEAKNFKNKVIIGDDGEESAELSDGGFSFGISSIEELLNDIYAEQGNDKSIIPGIGYALGTEAFVGGPGEPVEVVDAGTYFIDDVVALGNGNDTMWAMGGNDIVFGGEGNDDIRGEEGNDALFGQDGNDVLRGGDGDDYAQGGAGNDSIFGDAGDDLLVGDNGPDGNDNIHGGDGDDLIYGDNWDGDLSSRDSAGEGKSDDSLHGDDGDDIIVGGVGNDYVSGGEGDDVGFGNEGDDTLRGGPGDDNLIGGEGSDDIWGGPDSGETDRLAGGDWVDFVPGEGEETCVDEEGRELFEGSNGEALARFNEGDVFWLDTNDDGIFGLRAIDGGEVVQVDAEGDYSNGEDFDTQETRGEWGEVDGDAYAYGGWVEGEDGVWSYTDGGGFDGEETIVGQIDGFDHVSHDGEPDAFHLEPTAEENGYDKIFSFEAAEMIPEEEGGEEFVLLVVPEEEEHNWMVTDYVDAKDVDFDFSAVAPDDIPDHHLGPDEKGEELNNMPGEGEGFWDNMVSPADLLQYMWYDGESGQLFIDLDGEGEGEAPVPWAEFIETNGLGEPGTLLGDNVAVCIDLPNETLSVIDFDPSSEEQAVCVDEGGRELFEGSNGEALAHFNEGDVFWLDTNDDGIFGLRAIDGGEVVQVDAEGDYSNGEDFDTQETRGEWGEEVGDTWAGGWHDEEGDGLWNEYGDPGEVVDETYVGYIDANDEINHEVSSDQVFAVWDTDHWDFVDVA